MFCGMKPDHTIECWGWDEPAAPPVGVAFASFDMSSHAGCALSKDGRPTCWGDNSYGQLDIPDEGIYTQIAMGGQHGCALDRHGEAICWGSNRFGQLDALQGPFVQLGSGMRATCGIRRDGDVVCWGCVDDDYCDID